MGVSPHPSSDPTYNSPYTHIHTNNKALSLPSSPFPADDGPVLATDAAKHKWLGHKKAVTMPILKLQIEADFAAGFDYTGYHAYARKRYFELHDPDVEERCVGVPEPFNTTCR